MIHSEVPSVHDNRASQRPIVVGTWPGLSFKSNEFVRTFAQSLIDEGCTVVDVTNPAGVRDRLDVLHVHWPELVFWQYGRRLGKALDIFRTFRAIRRMQRCGTRVVWMVHNLRPHDLSGLRRRIWPYIERFMLHHSDGFMTLAPSTIDVVHRTYPQLATRPAAAALHPVYRRIAGLPDRAACRADLSLAAEVKVFALPGLLRPYKGTEALITAFLQNRDPDNRLLIAGNPISRDYGAAITALAAGDPRIVLKFGFLDDWEFAMCLEAADCVVLPYQSSLHSGALVHALSYGRMVITPAAPFANDIAKAVGNQWVDCYQGDLKSEIFERRDWPAGLPDLTSLQPREMGRTATAFYRSLVYSRSGA